MLYTLEDGIQTVVKTEISYIWLMLDHPLQSLYTQYYRTVCVTCTCMYSISQKGLPIPFYYLPFHAALVQRQCYLLFPPFHLSKWWSPFPLPLKTVFIVSVHSVQQCAHKRAITILPFCWFHCACKEKSNLPDVCTNGKVGTKLVTAPAHAPSYQLARILQREHYKEKAWH